MTGRPERPASLFPRFALVGALGFCCDAGLLSVLMGAGVPTMASRSLSISAAVSATFWLNRRFTFCSPRRSVRCELPRYLVVSAAGAGVNYAVFALLVALLPASGALWGMPAGSAAALAVNFLGARNFAFRGASTGARRNLGRVASAQLTNR